MGSPMQITLGQQYGNIEEKPTVILYSYINRHAGTPEKRKRQDKTSSNSKDESNTSLKREQRTMVMRNLHIQVHDTIHLELAEEQWEITQGSKRRAERTALFGQLPTSYL